jgi:L-alanine-DL-glutamate epimerase-like enolase superfamily enzyme
MTKSTDIRIADISSSTETIGYRTPIKFGGRIVDDVTLFHVRVVVETRDGKRGTGFGSMPVGNVWGWPSAKLSGDQTLTAMIQLATRMVNAAGECQEYGHPLELTSLLAETHSRDSAAVTDVLGEAMPVLARLVCSSPLEAAIHDAYGRTHEQNSYNLLGPDWVNTDLSHYLDESFAGEYLDQYTLRQTKPTMPLYHLVGALDPLTEAELSTRLNDGLPETLGEWIVADGLTHLKIKLSGDDLAWDVQRVAGTESAAVTAQRERGCQQWFYSLDFNERCENVAYVLEFLSKLAEAVPEALHRVQYIEQPTHRDLRGNMENRMHEAAKIKPVVIDESLVDYESLLLAQELGYSGVALKACKGQTEALLMGAAAQKHGLFLCVQDLTCVGSSFLHSASLAARIPSVAAIEGNGRQYCPAGNAGWDQHYQSMFQISDGTVGTSSLDGNGLGFHGRDSLSVVK